MAACWCPQVLGFMHSLAKLTEGSTHTDILNVIVQHVRHKNGSVAIEPVDFRCSIERKRLLSVVYSHLTRYIPA